MPIDREDTLKKAEKLVRQGKLDAAIAEYLRVVEDQPGDWTTANSLGIYVRAGQPELAAGQYAPIAAHFMEEGFYPKASAIYKKLLKLTPDDESAQLNLAELSQKQGLLADAQGAADRGRGAPPQPRRSRGAAEILVRRAASTRPISMRMRGGADAGGDGTHRGGCRLVPLESRRSAGKGSSPGCAESASSRSS